MKKLTSVLLCIAMLCAISIPTQAVETEAAEKQTSVTINEYETLAKLSKESTNTLTRAGYSSTEIAAIRNYCETYTEHVNTLNSLSDEVLTTHGYTPSQIATIRSFKGTETELTRLAAELTLYTTLAAFSYEPGERTVGTLVYNWEWTGVPAFLLRDMVAVAWNNWYLLQNTSNINYYSLYSGAFYTDTTAEYCEPTNGYWLGGGHRFDMTMTDNTYYAKSGGGSFKVQSDVHAMKDFYYYIEYGHAIVSPNISFGVSISYPPSASATISFSVATTTAGSKSGAYLWP